MLLRRDLRNCEKWRLIERLEGGQQAVKLAFLSGESTDLIKYFYVSLKCFKM